MAPNPTSPQNQTQGATKSADFSEELVTVLDPASSATEAYRAIRTRLLYSVADRPTKVLVVTSPRDKEGKTTTCANLGVVLAQAGKRTLIIDCDLRKPDMHQMFGQHNTRGVGNVVAGEYDLPEVWKEPLPGLKVATAGTFPPNSAEFLGSRRFAEIVETMREAFDYVLMDAPPTGAVSDPLILANQADGVLLVLDARKTRKRYLRETKRSLEAVGANLLGTIVNNAKEGKITFSGKKIRGR